MTVRRFDIRTMFGKALAMGVATGVATEAVSSLADKGISYDAAAMMLTIDVRSVGVAVVMAIWAAFNNYRKNR